MKSVLSQNHPSFLINLFFFKITFKFLVLDEAHERSIQIDIILGFIKRFLNIYKSISIIITSATIGVSLFFRYIICSKDKYIP